MKQKIYLILLSLFVIVACATNNNAVAGLTGATNTPVIQVTQAGSFDEVSQELPLEAELGGVGIQLYETLVPRVSRTQLKSSVLSLQTAEKVSGKYETYLLKHLLVQRNATVLLPITHPISKYYVFALRHIII